MKVGKNFNDWATIGLFTIIGTIMIFLAKPLEMRDLLIALLTTSILMIIESFLKIRENKNEKMDY